MGSLRQWRRTRSIGVPGRSSEDCACSGISQHGCYPGIYRYDGLGRRIRKALTRRGELDGTEFTYYAGPRAIELRNGSNQTLRQYVWGARYVDEIVRVDINGDPAANSDCLGTGDAAYYYHQDANYNVVAVTDMTSAVVQRIHYTAYGQAVLTDGAGHAQSAPGFGPAGNRLHTAALAWPADRMTATHRPTPRPAGHRPPDPHHRHAACRLRETPPAVPYPPAPGPRAGRPQWV